MADHRVARRRFVPGLARDYIIERVVSTPRLVTVATLIALLAAVVVGAVLRLTDLRNRPMHCDEAVHAVKLASLLEKEPYLYDPYEYHGPSLNFFTLPVAWAVSADTLSGLNEVHLRLVPAVMGILVIGLVWLVRDRVGRPAICFAAIFTAISPAMVFFSRYYIQEMLLVCFTFLAMAALWRYAGGAFETEARGDHRWGWRQAFWVVVFGVSAGLMHASKETCVIALFSMLVATGITLSSLWRQDWKRLAVAWGAAVVIGVAVSAVLFSSFFRNPHGVIDSYTTYFHYLGRASGEGSAGRHVQAWHYYFRLLFWWPTEEGLVRTEGAIAALALVGSIAAAVGRGMKPGHLPAARFLAVYTLLMTILYTVLPYKTPWCALGFLHGMILLAGVGAAVVVRMMPGYVLKGGVILLLLAPVGHLAWQAHRLSFVEHADVHNPHVYAHTTPDASLLAERIEELARCHPDGLAMPVQAICPDDDYWPLPWNLRAHANAQWYHGIPSGTLPAPVIVTQPEMEDALIEYLYKAPPPGQRYLYVPVLPDDDADDPARDWFLRPHVPLRVYARRDLWQVYRAEK